MFQILLITLFVVVIPSSQQQPLELIQPATSTAPITPQTTATISATTLDCHRGENDFKCGIKPSTKWCRWAPEDKKSSTLKVVKRVSGTVACTNNHDCLVEFAINETIDSNEKNGMESDFVTLDDLTGSVEQKVKCHVKPGYKVYAEIQYELNRTEGTLHYYQEAYNETVAKCGSNRGSFVEAPKKLSEDSDKLDAVFYCKREPIADMTEIEFDSNTNNTINQVLLPSGVMHLLTLKLMKAVSDSVSNMQPLVGRKEIVSDGVDVVAVVVAKCFSSSAVDSHSQQSICRGCLDTLSEKIWTRSKMSSMAKWKVRDCYLGYDVVKVNGTLPDNVSVIPQSSLISKLRFD